MLGLTCAIPLLLAQESGAQANRPAAPPAFHPHVAAIVYEHCAACHRPGQAAPFPLLTYDDVRRRGRMIVKVTEQRTMPPWHPVEGHGEFAGEMRLTSEEIATLRAFVEAGMAEGDPALGPPPPEFPTGWYLREPDLVVQTAEAFEVPASGPDIYRNFVIPLRLDEDRYVTAIEVRPSARSVLHHVIFSFDTTGRARARDGKDGKPGFDGMGGEGGGLNGTAAVGGWAVGGLPRELPLGLARRVPKGADLVLRCHFHPSGKVEREQTTLGLYFAKEPPTRSMIGLQLPPAFGAAAGLDLPPGSKDFALRDEFVLPVDVLAVEVGGHAHYLCTQMQVWVTPPDGERRSIFWIEDWDFAWQNRYQYAEPMRLPVGTKVEVAITYDNSADNPRNPHDPPRHVRFGLQSTDEMGSITLLLVPERERDAGTLQRAVQAHVREHFAKGRGNLGFPLVSRAMMLDRDGDGRIDEDEIPPRLRAQVLRLDLDRDGAVDAAELEEVVQRLGSGRGVLRERGGRR
ncbi:MAG TPA: cytochrome c [Planctomycetota bacterium]|nr:cytochrome c [Planctomycetota bacterium]